jgi:glycosyltransferase involved in cell wall biosynthesis
MGRLDFTASVDAASVSVLIPCYNSGDRIGACLESLVRQDSDICREIIVVDSSSDDMTASIGRSYPQVILIRSKERLLPGVARNVGAAIARGEILAFIDSDAVADRGWLRRIVEGMRSGYRTVTVGYSRLPLPKRYPPKIFSEAYHGTEASNGPTSLWVRRSIWKWSFARSPTRITRHVHDSASLEWSARFEHDRGLFAGSTDNSVETGHHHEVRGDKPFCSPVATCPEKLSRTQLR